MTQEATRYRCPCCGASLVFGGLSQQLDCPSCGNSFPVETLQEIDDLHVENTTDEQLQWAPAQNAGFSSQEGAALKAYRCEACGAEILKDETTAATECVYCGNPTILPDVLTGAYRPDGVIPFKKTREDAQRAFKNHCRGKRLLPDGFADNSRVEKITGVYVPFWLFACEAEADVTYNAKRVSVSRQGNYQVTRTAHFLLHRGGRMDFSQVPVDGSSKMEDALMESIEPYDGSAIDGFSIAFLSGYQAQRHDVDADACRPRANERIRETVSTLMRDTVKGYTGVTPANTQIQLENTRVRQILMPVWMLNTRYRDKLYTFAMNGQTGRFIGDLPTDKGKFWRWLLGLAGGITLGGYALIYLLGATGVLK